MINQAQELAQSFNMNEREFAEYNKTIIRVLADNFLQDVFSNKMTMQDAIRESVKLWDKKLKDMTMQILNSPMEGNGVTRKANQLAGIVLDEIYEAFNK